MPLVELIGSQMAQAGYSGKGERQKIPDTGFVAIIPNFPNPQTSYEALLSASWEIDLWGRVRRSVESSRAQAQASADDLETIKLMIQAEVAVDYFTLRALDTQRGVLNSSIQVFSKSLQFLLVREVDFATIHKGHHVSVLLNAARVAQVTQNRAMISRPLIHIARELREHQKWYPQVL